MPSEGGRYVAQHMPELGPGEVWWILDTETERYKDLSFTNGEEARAMARRLNTASVAEVARLTGDEASWVTSKYRS